MYKDKNGLTWHVLNSITNGNDLMEVMMATSEDGIGIIARWKRATIESPWNVTAIDTEQGMERVVFFEEGECVPENPPCLS